MNVARSIQADIEPRRMRELKALLERNGRKPAKPTGVKLEITTTAPIIEGQSETDRFSFGWEVPGVMHDTSRSREEGKALLARLLRQLDLPYMAEDVEKGINRTFITVRR